MRSPNDEVPVLGLPLNLETSPRAVSALPHPLWFPLLVQNTQFLCSQGKEGHRHCHSPLPSKVLEQRSAAGAGGSVTRVHEGSCTPGGSQPTSGEAAPQNKALQPYRVVKVFAGHTRAAAGACPDSC